MPLERRAVEAALEAKGFKRLEGDHAFFIYTPTPSEPAKIACESPAPGFCSAS